jgi:hypothetical protein
MDGVTLNTLTNEILEKEFGMEKFAHRYKFLIILNELKTLNAYSSFDSYQEDP